jgi:TonB family protein
VASWTTGTAPDNLPPVWRAPPSVEYAGSSMNLQWETSDVFVSIPAYDDGGALAVLVELRADPTSTVQAPAPQVGLRRLLAPTGTADPLLVLESDSCSQLHLSSGRVFEARLSVIDAAGHAAPSPAGALRFRIPVPHPQASYEVLTVLPSGPPVLVKPEPPFPAIARRAQIQGVVTGELSIGPGGKVEEVVVIEAPPMGLSQATVETLATWRFAPAADGAPQRKVRFATHFMVIQHEYEPDWTP